MISTCGIYSVKHNGAFNVPFVALNDEQAISIVKEALKDFDEAYPSVEVHRLGTLDFIEGITDVDAKIVFVGDIHGRKECASNEVSETV